MSLSPAQAIADLDMMLGHRETVRLIRRSGPSQSVTFEVVCPARVKDYKPEELVGNIEQGDSLVIISPTQINEEGWPGPATGPFSGDRRIPQAASDLIIIQQKPRAVKSTYPVYLEGILVRLNVQVKGGV